MPQQKSDRTHDGFAAVHLPLLYQRCAERRFRDRHSLVAVEGVRFVVRALESGARFRGLLVSRRLLTSRAGRKAAGDLARRGVPVARLSPEEFRQLSSAQRASGIAAVVEQRQLPLPSMTSKGGVWLGLRRIDAPGNLGTILRSMDAAGAAGALLLGSSIDLYQPTVVRASMGAVFDTTIVRSSHVRLKKFRARLGLQVLAADAEGGLAYDQVDLKLPTVLLLGHEKSGLTEEERQMADQLIRIPMRGKQSSINVASAASVFLFEALRQQTRSAETQIPPSR